MLMSSVMNGNFRGAASPNSFSGVFPLGARMPVKPNPLTQPVAATHGKADVAGIQAAMSKRGEKAVKPSYRIDNEHGLTGDKAVESLAKYMKSAGLDSFQSSFFCRLITAGMPEAEIRQCIKQAGETFGDDIEMQLTAGMSKLAGGFPGSSFLKPLAGKAISAVKSLPGKALSVGKSMFGKAPEAAKAVAGSVPGKAARAARAMPVGFRPPVAAPVARSVGGNMAGKALGGLKATGRALTDPRVSAAVGTLGAGAGGYGLYTLPGTVDRGITEGKEDIQRQMHHMVYGFDNEDGSHLPGLRDEMTDHVNGIRGELSSNMGNIQQTLDHHGNAIGRQIGSVTEPVSGLMSNVGNWAGKAKDYLTKNPAAAAALLAAGGAGLGGLMGGRRGAVLGGAGLPLAYLASQGQFGDLSKWRDQLGLGGNLVEQQQMAQEEAATRAAQAAQQQQLGPQRPQQSTAPQADTRNELTANQVQ